MASSPQGEVFRASPGRTHHARLTRLLICGGTAILREFFDSIHPPANLSTVLKSPVVYSMLNRMKKRRILTLPQWQTLFPSPGTYGQSKTFDITLLTKLFQEICSLTAPTTGWNSLPIPTDIAVEADLVRIKYFRNDVYGHVKEDMELRDEEFVRLWNEIKDALLRIVQHYAPGGSSLVKDWENAIDVLLTSPLTHEDEIHLDELEHRYLEDMEVKKTLEEMRRIAEETRNFVRAIAIESKDLQQPGVRTLVQEQGPHEIQQQLHVPLGIMLPEHWDPQPIASSGKESIVHLVPLNQNTKEYEDVKKAIEKTSPINIVKIERVQNPCRYRAYVVKKHEMDNYKNGSNEKKLFHGTAPETCLLINHHGFNRSFSGKNATVYGKGVYFARDASFCMRTQYSPADSTGNRYMYLVSVLVGEYTQGQRNFITPPPKVLSNYTITYDSVVNDINDPLIYCIFHDDQNNPDYLITFN